MTLGHLFIIISGLNALDSNGIQVKATFDALRKYTIRIPGIPGNGMVTLYVCLCVGGGL